MFVGIDPSLTSTGIVCFDEKADLLHASTCTSDRSLPPLARCLDLVETVLDRIQDGNGGAPPTLTAIEHYSYNSRFKQITLVELGTCFRILMFNRGWRYVDVQPLQVKKFVQCKKGKPLAQVASRWGFQHKKDDVVDAYILGRIALAKNNPTQLLLPHELEVVTAIRGGASCSA